MPSMMAPPWLVKLAAPSGPLVDDAEVHRELARMKVRAEREDAMARGELFRGPMAPSRPEPPRPLPFEPSPPAPIRPPSPEPEPAAPPSAPVPSADLSTFRSPAPVGMEGTVIAPPGAPPPADRPPDTFRFPPLKDDHAE